MLEAGSNTATGLPAASILNVRHGIGKVEHRPIPVLLRHKAPRCQVGSHHQRTRGYVQALSSIRFLSFTRHLATTDHLSRR